MDPGWVKIRIRDKHPGSATLAAVGPINVDPNPHIAASFRRIRVDVKVKRRHCNCTDVTNKGFGISDTDKRENELKTFNKKRTELISYLWGLLFNVYWCGESEKERGRDWRDRLGFVLLLV